MRLQVVLILVTFSASWVFAVPDKTVCFHESWSNWRPATGKFDISDIDTELCTHIIYSHIGIQSDGSLYLKDDDPGFLFAYGILRTRNPRPKLLVSINGWSDLSVIAANSNRRNIFLNNSINFLKQYCFDGIDFNLEDPGDKVCDSTDNNNIVTLLGQFRLEFNTNAFLLTASVSSSTNNYNVPNIVRNLDFVNVKTYHLHDTSDSASGHNLPYSETVKIINAWKNAGTPSDKLILGISAYGYSYKLQYNIVGTPKIVPGDAGTYTQQSGSLSYLEICEKIKKGVCTYKWNNEEFLPYANCENEWAIYEDTDSTLKKVKFALDNNLGGIFIWSINTDDFRGVCGPIYPLLNAVANALKPVTCTANHTQIGNIICYHDTSSYLRLSAGKFVIGDIDANLCTQINLATVGVYNSGTIGLTSENARFLNEYSILKTKNPRLKLLITLGGWRKGVGDFAVVAANPQSRKTLLTNAVNLIKKYNFDGLDFDWGYPLKRTGNSNDKLNFVTLLAEFRREFNKYCYLLTAAVPPTVIYFDVPEISKYLDFINVMAFGFHSPWESRTGHHSSYPDAMESITKHWFSAGAPRNKLVLGTATYGSSFTLTSASYNIIGAYADGPGVAGPYTREPGILGYNEICEKLMIGWTRKWSSELLVPYAYGGNQWVGYDDQQSIAQKAKFVYNSKMGGIMVWMIDMDDFSGSCGTRYPLLNAIKATMTGSSVYLNAEFAEEDLKEGEISNEFEILQSSN